MDGARYEGETQGVLLRRGVDQHTAKTEGLIGERELAVMKPLAVLVNIARGPWLTKRLWCAPCKSGAWQGPALWPVPLGRSTLVAKHQGLFLQQI